MELRCLKHSDESTYARVGGRERWLIRAAQGRSVRVAMCATRINVQRGVDLQVVPQVDPSLLLLMSNDYTFA